MSAGTIDTQLLQQAIDMSAQSIDSGGFPVGAVIARGSDVFATGISDGKKLADPTSHAEVAVIRELCKKLKDRNLSNYVLYSSMEPCLMCFGAAFWAYIPRIVYAAPKHHLSSQHYEGSYDLTDIQLRRPIELVHIVELESAALDIIKKWEDMSS